MGVQDSTVTALVADLVPATRRATAYGVFAAVQGAAAVLGGAMAGLLYERSLPALILAVSATQLTALTLLIITLRGTPRPSSIGSDSQMEGIGGHTTTTPDMDHRHEHVQNGGDH